MIILYSNNAKKELQKLSKPTYIKIKNKLNQYIISPQSVDIEKLKGYENLYRIRQGNYRIILEFIENDIIKLHVLHVKHRKEVYKDL